MSKRGRRMKPDTFAGRLVRALARDSDRTRQAGELSSLTFLRRVILAVARRPVEMTSGLRSTTSQPDVGRDSSADSQRGNEKNREVSSWFAPLCATAAAAAVAVFAVTGILATNASHPGGVGQSPYPSPTQTGQPVSPTAQDTAVSHVGNVSGVGSWLLILVGGLLVALGVGAIVLLWMRRNDGEMETTDPTGMPDVAAHSQQYLGNGGQQSHR